MNLYRITIQRPGVTRTMWNFAPSKSRIKLALTAKIRNTEWRIRKISFERNATGFEEYYIKKDIKSIDNIKYKE